jgi:hypothetical protein
MPAEKNVEITVSAATASIDLYQRYVSPYNGFRYTHRIVHGGTSCSQFVKLTLQQYQDVLSALPEMRQRFAACRAASELLPSAAVTQDGGRFDQRKRPCGGQGHTVADVSTLRCFYKTQSLPTYFFEAVQTVRCSTRIDSPSMSSRVRQKQLNLMPTALMAIYF